MKSLRHAISESTSVFDFSSGINMSVESQRVENQPDFNIFLGG